MFFFIGGVQPKTVLVDKQPRDCLSCGQRFVYLKRTDHYLSLFFIPLFPVKKGIPFLVCNRCGSVVDETGRGIREQHTENRCSHCGRSVEEDYVYCPYCGKSVG
jgi:DNA-directed RNA polymerase subunit RPC12/RpoP